MCDSAELAATAPGGGPWDPNSNPNSNPPDSNPDPFCQFETVAGPIDDTAGVTSTVMNSFTATWNETVTPPGATISGATLMSASAKWRLWVGDDDDGCNTPAGCRGQLACEIDPPLQATWLESGGFTLMNLASCTSVSVTLVCQP